MGIAGLLPLLKPVTRDTHISDLKGKTVGIDAYCWLHKGIYSCSFELCQGIPTDKYIKYCLERVYLLLRHGVKPYLVFDGGYLPAKAGKEAERRERREDNKRRGAQLLREGNAAAAHQFFSKAADVTPFMAHKLIQEIKHIKGVQYVVAPYEADAQLGYLARNSLVDAVITEDSDILLFGCPRVLFKLDRDGLGQMVDLKEVFSQRNDELDMRGMGEDALMTMCALSGCDYLPSVHGVGIKKAYRLVKRHKEVPKILRAVKLGNPGMFPKGYEVDFQRALLTFRHQRAFDPISCQAVHLTPLPQPLPLMLVARDSEGKGEDPLCFLGPAIDPIKATAVAKGDLDPITGEPFPEIAETSMDTGTSKQGHGAITAKRVGTGAHRSIPNIGRPSTYGGNGSGVANTPTPMQGVGSLCSSRVTTPSQGRMFGSTGKGSGSKRLGSGALCGQTNNLTKYWGNPTPKVGEKVACGGLGHTSGAGQLEGTKGVGGGGAVERVKKRQFGLRVAESITRMGWDDHDTQRSQSTSNVQENAGLCTTPPDKGARQSSQEVSMAFISPQETVISPGSFYRGFSPTPPGTPSPNRQGSRQDERQDKRQDMRAWRQEAGEGGRGGKNRTHGKEMNHGEQDSGQDRVALTGNEDGHSDGSERRAMSITDKGETPYLRGATKKEEEKENCDLSTRTNSTTATPTVDSENSPLSSLSSLSVHPPPAVASKHFPDPGRIMACRGPETDTIAGGGMLKRLSGVGGFGQGPVGGSGLRRQQRAFRPPLATRTSSGGGRDGDESMDTCGIQKEGEGSERTAICKLDAECLPSLPPIRLGNRDSPGVGLGLKRRRTLGVGHPVSLRTHTWGSGKGHNLDRSISRGSGRANEKKWGRRTKSLGTPKVCGGPSSSGAGDSLTGKTNYSHDRNTLPNLFARFARKPTPQDQAQASQVRHHPKLLPHTPSDPPSPSGGMDTPLPTDDHQTCSPGSGETVKPTTTPRALYSGLPCPAGVA
ncbi:unnamed protein product, partial [Discosporangium mesarthrocarpum]